MSESFKVGDKVRLTGSEWGGYDTTPAQNSVVTLEEVSPSGIAHFGRGGAIWDVYPESSPYFEAWGGVVVTDEDASIREHVKRITGVTDEEIDRFGSIKKSWTFKYPAMKSASRFTPYEIAGEPDPEPENPFATKVWAILDEIGNLLISKNEAYGDAALNPIRVFSKADTLEQLRVRIDDKLNRIKNGHEYANEDTVDDLIGYLVLYKVGSRG